MSSDKTNPKMFYGAGPKAFKNAAWLRNNETEAERRLWQTLKGLRRGFRFKRQHPIGFYIADFYCHRAKLIIEIDGSSHNTREQKLYDKLRTEEFQAHGLKVLRFSNEHVLKNIEDVTTRIEIELRSQEME